MNRTTFSILLAASLGLALPLVSGCGANEAKTTSSSSNPALAPLDPAALRSTVESVAKELLVPGAVVMLKTPNGEFSTLYGTSTLGGSAPVSFEQHIRVGSNTKTWTGTVILQQVQEGLIRLEDPVSKYRPDVPNGDNITIEQMLTMRSGLFNYTETLELNKTLDDEPLKAWQPEDLVKLGLSQKVYFEPGAGFHYSNTNTVLLGLIAEKLDGGKPLAKVFQDRLFTPLGMKNTALPDVTSNVVPQPNARGYMFGNNVMTMTTTVLPEEIQKQARAGTLLPADQTDVNASWAWAAGSGHSTAVDLVTWVEAMVGGKLLNAELQQKRLASPRPIDPSAPGGVQYGLQIAKFGPLYGHTGELPGYNSFMGHDPVNKVTLVVWTNLAPAVDGRDPATTIAKALIGQIYAAK